MLFHTFIFIILILVVQCEHPHGICSVTKVPLGVFPYDFPFGVVIFCIVYGGRIRLICISIGQ